MGCSASFALRWAYHEGLRPVVQGSRTRSPRVVVSRDGAAQFRRWTVGELHSVGGMMETAGRFCDNRRIEASYRPTSKEMLPCGSSDRCTRIDC